MAEIYLIRHGQASFGQENYDQLSAVGKEQAEHVGRSFHRRGISFERIILGTMRRHRQTAEHCLAAMGETDSEIDRGESWQSDDAWNEYDHQEILSKVDPFPSSADDIKTFLLQQPDPDEAFKQMFTRAIARWQSGDYDNAYAEPWHAYRYRILGAIKRCSESAESRTKWAVFTSGGPISVVAQELLGIPENRLLNTNWTLANCGVTKIVVTPRRAFVSTLNDHHPFEGRQRALLTYR